MKPIAFLAALLMANAAGAATLVLRADTVVVGEYFALGEIAAVQAADEKNARDLHELRIGRSPRVASTLSFRRAEVEAAILRLRPGLRGALRWEGAEAVAVRRGPLQMVQTKELRELAERALHAALAQRYARFVIEPSAEDAAALAVPAGRVDMKVRLPDLMPVPRRATVWIDVAVDARAYQSVPLAFGVQVHAGVLIARRALAAGENLRAGDFEESEAQIAGLAAAPVDASQALAALRLKRALAAGAPLLRDAIALAPAVARDEEVRVRLAVGAIVVETKALALKDGAAGDVIRVRAAAAGATYPVRVAGPGLVEALWR